MGTRRNSSRGSRGNSNTQAWPFKMGRDPHGAWHDPWDDPWSHPRSWRNSHDGCHPYHRYSPLPPSPKASAQPPTNTNPNHPSAHMRIQLRRTWVLPHPPWILCTILSRQHPTYVHRPEMAVSLALHSQDLLCMFVAREYFSFHSPGYAAHTHGHLSQPGCQNIPLHMPSRAGHL